MKTEYPLRRSLGVSITLWLFAGVALGDEKALGVWMSPGGPSGIWEKACGDGFPVARIVGDQADLGTTDIFFFEQAGRGGPFHHPTKVQYAVTDRRMKNRDYLRDLLEEAFRRKIRVWLAWTTPGGKYPGTEFSGLDDPGVQKIYLDEIEEVAANYGQYRNLAGILWHELDCTEAVDMHENCQTSFVAYCRNRFGEEYSAPKMPRADPADPWWRRFCLYKIHVMNTFVDRMAEAVRRHGLQTAFCSYTPESFAGESWRWGYDIVELEKLCDRQWFSAYSVESGKPYQSIRGAWLDFGPSYRGQILSRNYAYAFHGRPLSFFEYRSPIYLAEMRAYYSKIASFTQAHGDIYTGYLGRSAQEMDLFQGKQRFGQWLRLMTGWQGGVSPARVAVAVNPTPFILQHPAMTGGEYDKRVRGLMAALSTWTDVDGIVLGSRFALEPKNLRAYELIVIPEDMGVGLSAAMAESLRQYVRGGGKLLVVATPLNVARPDLTQPKDLTHEFCGLEVVNSQLPGYVQVDVDVGSSKPEKFWAGRLKLVRPTEAKVLARRLDNMEPAILMNGNVYFSAIGYSPESGNFFPAVAARICRPAVTLVDNQGMRILEGVCKDGLLCLSLWGPGQARLCVDVKRLGLPTSPCCVKDILTGQELCRPSAGQLRAGVKVEGRYVYQPLVLAIGAPASTDRFPGIYPSTDVFRGMRERTAQDNPEVPHESANSPATDRVAVAPTGPRDKEIGVLEYARKYQPRSKQAASAAFREACAAVRKAGLEPEPVDVDIFLPKARDARNRYKRLLIPSGTDWFSQAMYQGMDDYVRGGGLLITNCSMILLDADANYRIDPGDGITTIAQNTFLGVHGHASCTMQRVKVLHDCPLTSGLTRDAWLKLDRPLAGRQAGNLSAEVLVVSDRIIKGEEQGQQPFLTFKHQGNGACIYLVGQIGRDPEPALGQIFGNILSPATLQWLCR